MTLLDKAAENIARWELLPSDARILVGVSAGIDSMVLLHVLRQLSANQRWEIQVAHFNHLLRGQESDADEQFVRQKAAEYNLAFYAGRTAVAHIARDSGVSIEMAGRDARYAFFRETATRTGASRIALAHHADDQVETFWLRLLRGDVGTGLAGMRWRRATQENVEIVRPFLNIWRSEIIEFARTSSIIFREDPSNNELQYQRNHLRHEVLPALERFQPHLRQISLRTVEVLSAEKQFLTKAARDWMETFQPPFDQLERALQRELMRAQLLRLKANPTFDLIEHLRVCPNQAVMISPNVRVYRECSGELRELARSELQHSSAEKQILLTGPGGDSFEQTTVEWEFARERGVPQPQTEYFDADRVGSSFLLRHWRAGDRFQQCGAGGTAKLQDLFTNLKVPVEERRARLVAQTENGELFWVEGLRIGEEFKVTANTRRVLKWSWRRKPLSPT